MQLLSLMLHFEWCLSSSWWVLVVAVSPSHCVLAAGGGRAQLMSLSAAGRVWKRPFVGSCSASSPCASDTHSHRTWERNGTAQTALLPTQLTHRQVEQAVGSNLRLFGSLLYRTDVELTKTPGAKGGGKKHGDARKRKLIDFAGQRTLLFLFWKGVRRKSGFTAAERTEEKETRRFRNLFWLGAVSPFVGFCLAFELFSRWTHVEGKRSRDVWFEQAQTFSSGKGKKANENVGDMPEIGGV